MKTISNEDYLKLLGRLEKKPNTYRINRECRPVACVALSGSDGAMYTPLRRRSTMGVKKDFIPPWLCGILFIVGGVVSVVCLALFAYGILFIFSV